ncbi:MAG: ComEC/Rec2 family competence protein [Akkermansiaceae bacterium]
MGACGIREKILNPLPLLPLLLGVLAGVLIADHDGLEHWIPVVGTSLAIALVFPRGIIVLFFAGLGLAYVLHGTKVQNLQAWIEASREGKLGDTMTLTGVIVDTGPEQNGPYLVKASRIISAQQTHKLPPTGGMKVELEPGFRERLKVQYGDTISVSGALRRIEPMRNPHGFNRQEWLYRQGAVLSMTPHQPLNKEAESLLHRPFRLMTGTRQHLRQKMTAGLDAEAEPAQLIRAVVLGETPKHNPSMVDDFRQSGTLHVFAVSGLHVGMVGAIFASLLWLVRAPRWVLILGVILAMSAYAGITGLRPPAVRAVIMASVFLTGFLIRRKPSLINSLATSAIIVILWDGHQLFTPGFQLSYGVLLAIALAGSPCIHLLRPMATIDPFLPRQLLTPWQERMLAWRKWLRNSLAVSMAAWTGSAPLIWIYFGIVTPIAIIAGIPLMLMVFILLALALLSIGAGTLWQPAGDTLNHVNALVAKSTYHTAALFAGIPGGHWYRQPARPEKGRVIVFDIPGGGGANLIDVGGGILLDSGRGDAFYRHVLPSLRALGIHPDSLIITHADSRHSGSMSLCLDHFSPRQAIIPRMDLLSTSYREFLHKSGQRQCHLIIPRSGQSFPIERGVSMEILQAPAELDGYGRADDSGLVIRLHWHGWKILFTGDAGFITEHRLLASDMELGADVIISGRNRGDFTGHEDFYRAVAPRVIISSNAAYPENERIPQNWFKRTASMGIITVDQQQTGALTLDIEKGNLIITPTLRKAKPITIHPRGEL